MLRVGVIGFGKMGRLRADRAKASGRAEVVAVCDPYAKPTGLPDEIKVYEDWFDVVVAPDVDAVFVATVNVLNKPVVMRALEAGKHVFCEKPPAFTAKDVIEIMAVERASRCKLMYGFNHRLHGAAVHMRNIIDSRKYGRTLWMRGRYGKSVDADFLSTWRANRELSGGGILIDQGIHMIDLFLYLGGPFDDICAMVSSLYWKQPGIEDNVFALFRNTKTGQVASLHSTMTQWRHLFSLEVFMERGYMVLNGLKTSSNSYGQEELAIATNRSRAPAATWEDEERFVYETDLSWDAEATIFFDAIEKGLPIVSGSSSHALEVMRLVDKIYAHERHESDVLYTDLNALLPS
jgi:1,5-anhydro-D-fructose reductase (1,5-anhydro-D-mannitol-forming)